MKKIMTVTAMLVFAISMFAKDIKTVVFTTLPQIGKKIGRASCRERV